MIAIAEVLTEIIRMNRIADAVIITTDTLTNEKG